MPLTLACRMCNHAIVAKVLQCLEAMENGVYVKDSKDRLVSTAATQAGADALRQMPYMQSSIQDLYCLPQCMVQSHGPGCRWLARSAQRTRARSRRLWMRPWSGWMATSWLRWTSLKTSRRRLSRSAPPSSPRCTKQVSSEL